MVLEQLTGNLFQGVVLGTVYGMATMGLSLIFGVLKVVNVGHGAFIMVGAFTAFVVFESLGLSPIFAIPVAMAIGMALGMMSSNETAKMLGLKLNDVRVISAGLGGG